MRCQHALPTPEVPPDSLATLAQPGPRDLLTATVEVEVPRLLLATRDPLAWLLTTGPLEHLRALRWCLCPRDSQQDWDPALPGWN